MNLNNSTVGTQEEGNVAGVEAEDVHPQYLYLSISLGKVEYDLRRSVSEVNHTQTILKVIYSVPPTYKRRQ